MMKLILVRHGHVEGIAPPRFRGRKDVPLTALGSRQAAATADRIAAEWRVDAVYTSPMSRSRDTARAIAGRQELSPHPLPELLDVDYGEWSWKTHEEVRRHWQALYDQWFGAPHLVRIPGGDTLHDLALRAGDFVRLMLASHDGETVVAVGHDSVNRIILLQLLDLPLSQYWRIDQYPCCINEIDIGARIFVRRINEHGHLFGLAGPDAIH
jgi:probable phosphoglycerate mutase